jgi:phosphoglucomutase
MSKRNQVETEVDSDYNSVELDETDSMDIEDTDVGFLIDKDGNLKTVFGPAEGFENPSETVAAILEIFGIDELTSPNRTLH